MCKEGRNIGANDDKGVEQAETAKPIIDNEKQDPLQL